MPEMSWKRFEGWPKSTRSDVRCLIVRFLCDWKHFSRASSILTQKSEQKDNKMWFCPQIGDTADTLNLPLRWENEKRFGLRGTMGYLVSMIMSLICLFWVGPSPTGEPRGKCFRAEVGVPLLRHITRNLLMFGWCHPIICSKKQSNICLSKGQNRCFYPNLVRSASFHHTTGLSHAVISWPIISPSIHHYPSMYLYSYISRILFPTHLYSSPLWFSIFLI